MPNNPADLGELAETAQRIASVYGAGAEGTPRTLLLVDDELSIRVAVGKFLRARGFDVTEAANGVEALDALFRQRFDAMICDVRMPEMTGLEVVPSALESSPDIAIVMLTAVNDAPTATEALALGALDYLIKPVELDALVVAVERALARREADARQRNVEFLIREEFTSRTGKLYHTQEVLLEALFLSLGDFPPAETASRLAAIAEGRLIASDLEMILNIVANRRPPG